LTQPGLGVLDQAFIDAVMAVDLTRPMFSDARCALVDFAPDLDIKSRSAPVPP
jgi:hypothetical protein